MPQIAQSNINIHNVYQSGGVNLNPDASVVLVGSLTKATSSRIPLNFPYNIGNFTSPDSFLGWASQLTDSDGTKIFVVNFDAQGKLNIATSDKIVVMCYAFLLGALVKGNTAVTNITILPLSATATDFGLALENLKNDISIPIQGIVSPFPTLIEKTGRGGAKTTVINPVWGAFNNWVGSMNDYSREGISDSRYGFLGYSGTFATSADIVDLTTTLKSETSVVVSMPTLKVNANRPISEAYLASQMAGMKLGNPRPYAGTHYKPFVGLPIDGKKYTRDEMSNFLTKGYTPLAYVESSKSFYCQTDTVCTQLNPTTKQPMNSGYSISEQFKKFYSVWSWYQLIKATMPLGKNITKGSSKGILQDLRNTMPAVDSKMYNEGIGYLPASDLMDTYEAYQDPTSPSRVILKKGFVPTTTVENIEGRNKIYPIVVGVFTTSINV